MPWGVGARDETVGRNSDVRNIAIYFMVIYDYLRDLDVSANSPGAV